MTIDESPVRAPGYGGIRPAPRAERVSVDRYRDQEFARLEEQKLWRRVWQLACFDDEVAEPGDFYEYQLGPFSILLVRGEDRVLRGYHNSCLHRGGESCAAATATPASCGASTTAGPGTLTARSTASRTGRPSSRWTITTLRCRGSGWSSGASGCSSTWTPTPSRWRSSSAHSCLHRLRGGAARPARCPAGPHRGAGRWVSRGARDGLHRAAGLHGVVAERLR